MSHQSSSTYARDICHDLLTSRANLIRAVQNFENSHMATMHERQNNFAGFQSAYGGQPNHYSSADQAHRAPNYLHPTMPMASQHPASNPMATLTQGLGALTLQQASFAHNKPSPQLPNSSAYGGVPLGQHMPTSLYGTGQYLTYPGNYMSQNAAQPHSTMQQNPAMYSPVTAQFMPQSGYQGYSQHVNNHSPLSQTWSSRAPSGEIPSLVTPRRDSVSSNEQDQPGTPYTSTNGYGAGVAVVDRTPPDIYGHHTPSPTQLAGLYVPPPGIKAQQPTSSPPASILALLAKEPAIPRAIPAPSSPLKPLDRALQNPGGETNVYIRGLQPETTDEILHTWGSRFGDIKSSKSIIDHNTGLCKGFGFIKYHNYEDAGICIRGFHHLGYEVSFARESFYAKLKKFADDSNTNLYVSNLPRSMNEHELSAIFNPHKVCSSRILRDPNGNGRGVGFARFESRDVCEEIIKNFNNTPVSKPGEEEHSIQIRYADTEQQKWLKQQTAAARQFRTAEYEYATANRRWMATPNRVEGNGTPAAPTSSSNELETYLASTAGTSGPRYVPPAFRQQVPNRQPLTAIHSQQAVPTVQQTKLKVEPGTEQGLTVDIEPEAKTGVKDPAIAHGDSHSNSGNSADERD
ncbi:MAG: hypothetical protein M1821_000831 [Bathelium mastoideum]|nr:MAG: hypothetical protein M1821_000831 [Bathelium mastoideum]